MTDQPVYPFTLDIRTKNLGTGWRHWKQLAFKSANAAEIRFYKFAKEYFQAYSLAEELEGIIEKHPSGVLVDTLSAKRSEFYS